MRPPARSRLRMAAQAGNDALRGRLPDRYGHFRDLFDSRAAPCLLPGARVLDVGSGQFPSFPRENRPDGCYYVGLDLSLHELRKAAGGSYDDIVVGDVAERRPELTENFDLVLSLQVLEHVKPLDLAFENLRSYLRPGGRLVSQFSGAFSFSALANRMIPDRAAVWLLTRLLGRDEATIFPAYYDQCWHDRLQSILAGWSRAEVTTLWYGAEYLAFMPPLQAAYIAFEEWARMADYRNMATFYVIDAVR